MMSFGGLCLAIKSDKKFKHIEFKFKKLKLRNYFFGVILLNLDENFYSCFICLNQYKDKSYLERLISTNFFNLIVFNNSKENKVYRISNNIKNKLLLFLPNEPYNCHLPQINVDKLKSIFPAKLLWNK